MVGVEASGMWSEYVIKTDILRDCFCLVKKMLWVVDFCLEVRFSQLFTLVTT